MAENILILFIDLKLLDTHRISVEDNHKLTVLSVDQSILFGLILHMVTIYIIIFNVSGSKKLY